MGAFTTGAIEKVLLALWFGSLGKYYNFTLRQNKTTEPRSPFEGDLFYFHSILGGIHEQ